MRQQGEDLSKLSAIFKTYGNERNGLIPILLEIQKEFGYLPKEALKEVATFLKMKPIEVWGVATFYNQFRLTPLGKTHIKVCMGTACHLAGGRLVLEALERELDLKVGQTSEDGQFSLERVACIGCCMLAPVVVIRDKIYPKMSPFKVEESLIPYRQEAESPSEGEGKD
jgi:NADH-quinone oxidoreductase subunit E